MREIKFRVWDKLMKQFVKRCDMTDITLNFYSDQQTCDHSDLIYQQFTGLKDLQKHEIYEGDIINLEGAPYIYPVVWNRWQWGIDATKSGGDSIQGFTSAIQNRAIIVGNIFENPELLK